MKGDLAFMGDLAVFADTKVKKILYIGNGEFVENDDFFVACKEGMKGNITLEYSDEKLLVRSNVPIMLKTKNGRIREKLKLKKEIVYHQAANEIFK